MPSLVELNIGYNQNEDNFGEYPKGVFSDLHSLQTLIIDGLILGTFHEDFSKLTRIQNLDLDDCNCMMTKITNKTFAGFRNSTLKTLNMHCTIIEIETCAFCELSNLRSLNITRYVASPEEMLLSLYGLQNNTMDVVNIMYNHQYQTTFKLTKSAGKYAENICVKQVSLRGSQISQITNGFLSQHSTLMKCLEHIDIAENFLRGNVNEMIKLLNSATNLKSCKN